jgi:hypothetical protein
MESSTLRNLAYNYLHFAARYFDLLGGTGSYQFLLILFFSLACAVLAIAVYPGKPDRRLVSRLACSSPVYAGILMLAVLWSRLPWLIVVELNSDEGMLLAGARKLTVDPVFWRSVDGATSGPLNFYALLLPWALGLPLDYATAHLMNGLCFGGALVFLYLTARVILPEWGARLSVLPVLGAVMVFHEPDFTHYSSECVSVLLTMAATWLLATAWATPEASPIRFFGVGLIVAAMPLAKLQSIPLAAVLGIAALATTISRARKTGWLPVMAMPGGILTVAAALAVLLAVFGQLETFWLSYIINNTLYNSVYGHVSWSPFAFARFVVDSDIGGFSICLLIYLAAAAGYLLYSRRSQRRATVPRLKRQPKQNRPKSAGPASIDLWAAASDGRSAAWLYKFGFGLAAAGVCAVYLPGRRFPHYLLLILMPLGLLSVLAFSAVLSWETRKRPGRQRPIATGHAAVFLGIVLAIPSYIGSEKTAHNFDKALALPFAIECVTCDFIRHYAGPGDPMSQWGWEPALFVFTGTIPASRESFTGNQILDTPQRDYYRRRFLNDLRQHPPKVFIDTVGSARFGFQSRQQQGHESYPPLEEYVRSNFQLADDDRGVRIYVRRDVLAAASRRHAKVPLRLKCGGAGLTDGEGNQWVSDFYYSHGETFELPEVVASGIFRTARLCREACAYTIPIDNGTYRVRLHFMASYEETGGRLFDISIGGAAAARNFDIVTEAGGKFKPLVREFPAAVTGQKLVIAFEPKKHAAVINGIEILPAARAN